MIRPLSESPSASALQKLMWVRSTSASNHQVDQLFFLQLDLGTLQVSEVRYLPASTKLRVNLDRSSAAPCHGRTMAKHSTP